ncbi:MAG: zinc ribbon domain-containing protein [Planctomycetes bacterium]|nr:zinc ribbon domain-containing protein [Planctomycetota bacterium]
MPLLEFRCGECEHRFEDLVRSAAEAACLRCGSRRVERLLSAFAVRSSGGGSAPSACEMPPAGGCGSCGDPRGPGACRLGD